MSKQKIAKNRYWNFRQLIKTVGGNNAAARLLEKTDSFVTSYASKAPTRNIGDQFAQQIERAFKLPPGSLDKDPPATTSVEDEYLSEIVATLANASNYTRQFILAASQFAVAHEIGSRRAGQIPEAPKQISEILLTEEEKYTPQYNESSISSGSENADNNSSDSDSDSDSDSAAKPSKPSRRKRNAKIHNPNSEE